MWNLWWTKWHWGRFPLPIVIPTTAPNSQTKKKLKSRDDKKAIHGGLRQHHTINIGNR
jgi:hypothetical protein